MIDLDSHAGLDSSELYKLADAHWDKQEYAEALSLYQASLDEGWHSITELRVAQCLFALGRFDEIVKLLTEAVERQQFATILGV